MKFFIEIVADSHSDAMSLLSDARKILKRGVGPEPVEKQFCLGAVRVSAREDECECKEGTAPVVRACSERTTET